MIGMHFFNPVPVLRLVEVIRADETSDETAAAIVALARDLGKEPVEARDVAGFVSNRILMPFINEAVWALRDGVAEPRRSTRSRSSASRHPMGPLALADLIGLDTCVAIMEVLQRGLGDEKYAPCPLLVEHVAGGPPRPQVGPRLLRVRVSAARLRPRAAQRGRERAARGREDLLAERVRGGEVGGAVHLEHDPAAVRRREQVDADEVAAERLGGREASARASGGGTTGTRRRAERDVRAPLAGLPRAARPRRRRSRRRRAGAGRSRSAARAAGRRRRSR